MCHLRCCPAAAAASAVAAAAAASLQRLPRHWLLALLLSLLPFLLLVALPGALRCCQHGWALPLLLVAAPAGTGVS
jgi:hypothetical protein